MIITDKLEYWKKRLLDLGKRNRLISCPLPSDGKRVQRHSLLISKPTAEELYVSLAENNGELSFPMPPQEDNADFGQEALEDYDDADINESVKTNQSSKELNKTLRNLMKKAKEFTEEKGLNALYLAFGFLNWRENGTDGTDMRSPLLLLPVKLTQEDLFSPFVLSVSDEGITTNHSLEQKLLNDFNVELPQFEEDTTFDSYLNNVIKAVSSLGWSVSNDVSQLSLFSFLKINMCRDLERNSDKISGHHIVRAVNGEVVQDNTNVLSGINGYDHDSTDPKEVFSVVDADSSQQDAIELAKKGVSFVLQGPPGTGKSQTITNIIAELIADGKKVLFVSEKMAALQVVYKRLSQVGLADFCLSLHNHNAKRREILDQFVKTIQLSREKVELQQDAFRTLYRLKEIRDQLNRYSKELHTIVEPLGKTIFQVTGFVARLENCRNIDFVQAKADTFTPELLSQCETALEEVTRIVSKSGYQTANPWNGCVLTATPTHEFRQRFLVDSGNLISDLQNGLELYKGLNDILCSNYDGWCFESEKSLSESIDTCCKCPQVEPHWIGVDAKEAIANIKFLSGYVSDWLSMESRLSALKGRTSDVTDSIAKEIETADSKGISSDIDNAVGSYNTALNERHTAEGQKSAFETDLNAICKKLLIVESSCRDETDKATKMLGEWRQAKETLLSRCDETVLSLGISDMLARYRKNYRSWTRALNPSYHKDRKSLIINCKSAEKLSYEDGLLLLDSISTVLTLNENYNRQADIAKMAKELFDSTTAERKCIETELEQATANLNTATASFSEKRKNLGAVVEMTLATIENELKCKESGFIVLPQYKNACHTLDIEIQQNSNFAELVDKLTWCAEFQIIARQYAFGDDFITAICKCDSTTVSRLVETVNKIKWWTEQTQPAFAKFADLFEQAIRNGFYRLPISKTVSQIRACKDNFASFEYLVDYRLAVKRLTELGIIEYLDKAKSISLSAEEIIPVFKKCFFRSWLDSVCPKFSAVNEFRRLRQDERVEQFKQLDKTHFEISKTMLLSRIISHLPNFDAFSQSGEMALLRREMVKQRKLMPTRLLIAALPNLLPTLKPCIMMSPLSVSTYLGSSNFEFDTVIFDEASQVRTEDAIGAIFRAKQAIIAGDSKQLPPTDFFSSSMSGTDEYEESDDGVIDDSGAYESLLDEATMLPTQTLLWHYRSRHEHLIAFSNAKIYNGNIVTFPSSIEKVQGMGVEYIHVAGGTYDRGGKNGNRAEAKRVAELVFEHFGSFPKRSLGIIAFGEVQQSAIQDALIAKRRLNPTFEPFFKEDGEESLFIKNLETVQGDERDTIIFSIGYAPDAAGRFIMNFGPLSREGGERRLNVAVTRARYNLKLVGSILPTDIDADRTSGQGPKLLRLYVDFAINGANAVLGEITSDNALCFDSPFETSVYEFLTKNGFDVATQVGCSGYRIDMAVRHPQYNGRFALGIECDGAMYHSARTARERDRLRQTVLEDMGWKIYRVWSTDWIKDRQTEGQRLLSAVNNAIANYHETAPSKQNAPVAKMTNFIDMETVSVEESMREGFHEKFSNIKSRFYGYANVDEIPRFDICETMLKALSSNYGLDRAELFKETAQYGYGWSRQGQRIKRAFEDAFNGLLNKKQIEEDDDGKIKNLTNSNRA